MRAPSIVHDPNVRGIKRDDPRVRRRTGIPITTPYTTGATTAWARNSRESAIHATLASTIQKRRAASKRRRSEQTLARVVEDGHSPQQ